ncbi:hypothetical protein Cni_G14634 [Canna indica]|uniref:Uncharacterized protein n=1 Tax=Canna indica TaxID=4628 RepID=A0AAQ3KFG8_9LILI|nr:hypothetical protein Cni_G14634 [Canna indica]
MLRNAVSQTCTGKADLPEIKAMVHGEHKPPVCPRPRRPSVAPPEFLFPLSCQHSHASHQGISEVLDMTISKKNEAGRECISMSTGCPPSCYCGSPPSRLENPLIHDVQFVQQADMYSHLGSLFNAHQLM